MKSVLVRGMEMPANCFNCSFRVHGWCMADNEIRYVGQGKELASQNCRQEWCPLAEMEVEDGDLH